MTRSCPIVKKRELSECHSKKTTQLKPGLKKNRKEKERNPARHFSRQNIWKAKEHMKIYSTSLTTEEMQIKTMASYIHTQVKMAKIKITDNIKH